MREIKHRHGQLAAIISGRHKTGLTKMFVKDLAWLQIRIICETLALACLVVHEDIPLTQAKDLKKAYKADFILKYLADLHADYFPKPVVEIDDPDFPGAFAFKDATSGFLTQAEMIKLYSRAGDFLHRGSVKSITTRKPALLDSKEVAGILTKMANLLAMHTIQPVDPAWIYLVRMANAKDQVEIKGFQRTVEGGTVDVVRRVES